MEKRYKIRKNDVNRSISLIFVIYLILCSVSILFNIFKKEILALNIDIYLLMTIINLLVFILPFIIFFKVYKCSAKTTFMAKRFKLKNLFFVIVFSVFLCFVGILFNYLASSIVHLSFVPDPNSVSGAPKEITFFAFLSVILLPAIFEELLFRGVLISEMEDRKLLGSMMVSGLLFAMLHSSVGNFLAPFICGIGYAFLAIMFKSVYPAIIAHFINNLIYAFSPKILMSLTKFGSPILVIIMVILFLIVLTLITLKMVESKIGENEKMFKGRTKPIIKEVAKNKLIWLIILIYIVKVVLDFVF